MLDAFGPVTRAWFADAFASPTRVQAQGWPAIASGAHTLMLAPTGSGKTLAAFLACLDRLSRLPADAPPGVRVLYLSPLKALAYDVERNLRAPLVGMRRAAERLDLPWREVSVGVRTGDTAQRDRRDMRRAPPDVLVTTPESLFLMLGSGQREILRTVETVIVDEIHAVAATKRGVHLALSLERLAGLCAADPQRVGLSATQRPLSEIARFLGGGREVRVVDTSEPPRLDLEIVVPVEDMEVPLAPEAPRGGPVLAEPRRTVAPSIWPALHPELLRLIRAHRTTIVFVNSRILCERLAQALNELAGEEVVQAHHGSIARAQREQIEDRLKRGAIPGIVATSSLELGIDMGAVDLVIQVASPGSVAAGLQRVGRAGHGVGQTSVGRIFPKFRGDLLEAAVVARHMREAAIESTRVPRNCLDVLAQHLVSMTAVEPWTVDALFERVTAAYPFAGLTRGGLVAVLDMLSGRYPSDEFADLRPRVVWDRDADVVRARRGAGLLALVNAGTIPDRGLFRVHLGAGGPRIGELDEEMVYESRKGDVIVLGASSWRIEEITRDQVIVGPAPGEPGRLPFWRGEGVGRPVDLGRALGAFVREIGERSEDEARAHIRAVAPVDALAARNLARYVHEERAVAGALPTDRCVVVERFRDELGDWRVCVLSPFGARVHQPWALALEAALSTRAGFDVQTIATDDGITLRFADAEEIPPAAAFLPDPDEVEDLVVEQLRHSAVFASRFRENAGRALLLPRRSPDRRRPLWQQRLKAQNLLAAASRYPGFPIVLETYRECLQDVFDVPGLVALLRQVRSGEISVAEAELPAASPFARSLVFRFVAEYLYEGDTPLAERRALALTLDRELLRELLGQEELRDLLDPDAVAAVELELQWLAEDRRATHPDAVHDLLRRLGDLRADEVVARCEGDAPAWLAALVAERRAVAVRIAGEARFIAAEDAGWFQEALGTAIPSGVPVAFRDAPERPLEALFLRWARTRGPFREGELAARYGLREAQVAPVLRALEAEGRLVRGALRPGGVGREWCEVEVLRRLRRRSLAAQRKEVEPVEAEVFARFLADWHGLGASVGGAAGASTARLQEALARLEGRALPFSALEEEILPARLEGYHPRLLDELGAMGLWTWVGAGALGARDGRVRLVRRERAALLLEPPPLPDALDPLQRAILEHLEARGASFLVALSSACGHPPAEALSEALWALVWAGLVTNDTFAPLRALAAPRRKGPSAAGGRWSLVAELLAGPSPAPTARAHARAMALLDRYGVASREAVQAEELPGGFSAVYPVLRAAEEAGKARRGWFVEGLGGAQFASPGAVDRLRSHRERGQEAALALSALDPACPWGALLPWPVAEGVAAPKRVPGARVLQVGGAPVLYVHPGGKGLTTLRAWADPARAEAAIGLLCAGRYRTVRVERIDGEPAARSPHAEALRRAGFAEDPKGLVRLIG